MQPNELRIDNWVLAPGRQDFAFQVNGESICNFWKGELDLKPVPITEEWLIKFGWIWNEDCNSYEKYPYGDARMNLQFRSLNGSYTMFNYVLKALISDRLYYVHQLQNLYFALTGKELTIKDLATP